MLSFHNYLNCVQYKRWRNFGTKLLYEKEGKNKSNMRFRRRAVSNVDDTTSGNNYFNIISYAQEYLLSLRIIKRNLSVRDICVNFVIYPSRKPFEIDPNFLSDCATMSHFFIKLCNHGISSSYCATMAFLCLTVQPCLTLYCTSMSWFFILLRNQVLFLCLIVQPPLPFYSIAQPRLTFHLITRQHLISSLYCITTSYFFSILHHHVLLLFY